MENYDNYHLGKNTWLDDHIVPFMLMGTFGLMILGALIGVVIIACK